DAGGAELWTRQFGTAVNDFPGGLAADASGVYVAGSTHGTLPGQTSAGDEDAFVRKYDAAGTELWTPSSAPTARIGRPASPWTVRASTWPALPPVLSRA